MNRGGEDTKILLERSGMNAQLAGHLAANTPAGECKSIGDVALNIAGVESGAGPAPLRSNSRRARDIWIPLKTLDTGKNQALTLGGTTLSAQQHSALTDMMNMGGETGANLLNVPDLVQNRPVIFPIMRLRVAGKAWVSLLSSLWLSSRSRCNVE